LELGKGQKGKKKKVSADSLAPKAKGTPIALGSSVMNDNGREKKKKKEG